MVMMAAELNFLLGSGFVVSSWAAQHRQTFSRLERVKPRLHNQTTILQRLNRTWNLARGVIHNAGICLAVVPSERRPVLTRFGHALELRRAQCFTFHCRVKGRGTGREQKGWIAACRWLYHFRILSSELCWMCNKLPECENNWNCENNSEAEFRIPLAW